MLIKPSALDRPFVGDRRTFIKSMAGLSALAALPMPAWAKGNMDHSLRNGMDQLSGPKVQLHIGEGKFSTSGRSGHGIGLNGTIPGPLIRLREGQHAELTAHNMLGEDSSVHWHGLLLPFQFDGVPGLSYPGIKPGKHFTAEFDVRQSGTYWYHSHSGLQEQMGHYGPMIIDPEGKDPIEYDREHVILLSEFTPMHPHQIMKKLKVAEGYFSQQKTASFDKYDLSIEERLMWGRMRMMPTDIADVSAPTYTYMINGHGSEDGLELAFEPGERVRLRFINGSAMTFFNIRIPGLPLTIVQADGQNVRPVEVDEFQMGIAETYDVIVTPKKAGAFGLVAESMDRSGMATASLTSRAGQRPNFPELRDPPLLSMVDMGHGGMAEGGHNGHGGSGHGSHGSLDGATDQPQMDHGKMDHSKMNHSQMKEAQSAKPSHSMESSGHDMSGMKMRDTSLLPEGVQVGPGIDMVAMNPQDRMGYPGLGLDNVDHRVLNYKMLRALSPNHAHREHDREMELHLTGNMERYMWSLDGKKFSALGNSPLRFAYDEKVRIKLVNDTMMAHPIHLHGIFFELVNGAGHDQPKKHTVIVQPGSSATFDATFNEPGDWAFHCHLLFHMHAGMMQTVSVAFPEKAS